MQTIISLDINLELIQSIRLMHAITESSFTVTIQPEEAYRFSHLKNAFHVPFCLGLSAQPLPNVLVRHEEPQTSIGSLSRPLIFPHAITRWCRNAWPVTRGIHTSFCGLISSSRKVILQKWLDHNTDGGTLPPENAFLARLNRKLLPKSGHRVRRTYDTNDGRVLFWSSTRGRSFPVKAWDEEYFRILLESQFVLCPSGDYVWSYRFFEAILCGAVPIVEEKCSAYDGFQFYDLGDHELMRSPEMVEHNYSLCLSRLTVTHTDLDAEISSLLENMASGASAGPGGVPC